MSKIRNFLKKFGGNGQIKNYSSKTLWVIETTSDSQGLPVAHMLKPNHKSPKKIDADGFKRFDGKPIRGHKSWWKIWDYITAKIYDRGYSLGVSVIYMRAVSENQFGKDVTYSKSAWGEPIRNVIGIKKDKKGRIEKYYVEDYGWLSKSRAVWLASRDKIDNAIAVFPNGGSPYLRSRPDDSINNNFSSMA